MTYDPLKNVYVHLNFVPNLSRSGWKLDEWSEEALKEYRLSIDFDAEFDENQPPYGFDFDENDENLVKSSPLIKGDFLLSLEQAWKMYFHREINYETKA
jgi:hypothetical protein